VSFFNKKEDVIEIKLTQFGKRLMSLGAWKPKYYAFFDDDIIYDSKYCGFFEHQNKAEDRIKNSLRNKTQYLVAGVETAFGEETKRIKKKEEPLFPPVRRSEDPTQREKLLQYFLSQVVLGSSKGPYFNLALVEGEIHNSASISYLSGSGIQTNIPQLSVKSKYIMLKDLSSQSQETLDSNAGTMVDSEDHFDLDGTELEFLDGSKLEIKEENFIVDLREYNVPMSGENFQIELYEILTSDADKEISVPLTDRAAIEDLFEINIDREIEKIDFKTNKNKRLFSN